ncbi:S1C family serine protease [Deinococcus aquiradiocola]|uniref:Serine protease n=1 Tax=Deinococcus aquiradiocola TaxID=393059 RepID=A0A917UV61_9DEIO|nr:S1C family serine protease [Deinococcus aquiradiocola]GGJ87619.1 serine protease [Deinococcus aquiradiocola]
MNVARAHRRVLGLSVLLLLAAPAGAQKTSRPAPAAPQVAAGLPATLAPLYQKFRPAALEIDDCAPAEEDPQCEDPNGLGSGVLVSADGSVLTAYHVVFGADRLQAVTLDRKRYPVTVVGFDEPHDLALLKIDVKGAPFVPLAPQAPRVGQLALAIGNSGGKFLQPKSGRLLALDAQAGRADFPPGTLQLDAPLAPGDSGGPILNEAGQLIGITSYIRLQPGPKTDALPPTASVAAYRATLNTSSYAVPVTASSALLAQLRAGLKREAPVVGISTSLADYELPVSFFRNLGLGGRVGFVFDRVIPGGPADTAGLRPLKATRFDENGVPTHATGDVITAVNGTGVSDYLQFLAAIRSHSVGDQVTLTVYRDGALTPLRFTVKLAPRTISLGQTKP